MTNKLPQRIKEYVKAKTNYDPKKINRLFNIESKRIKNKIKVNSGRIELVDHLTIKEKDGIYIGYLKKSNIENIEIDQNLYNKYENEFCNYGLFGRFFLESNLHEKLLFHIREDSFEPLEYIDVQIRDLDEYFEGKSIKERMDIVLATLGYEADSLLFWQKIFILIRVITFCEKSFHILELGGKLVGKSSTYSMFPDLQNMFNKSPTIPEVFFNRQNKEDGKIIKNLVLIFDEVREISFKDDFLPTIQHYMDEKKQNSDKESKIGNRSIPFGTSIIFMGNIIDPINKMKNNTALNEEMKSKFLTSPFLDRFSFFIPSWGMVEHNDSIKLKSEKEKIPLNLFTKYLVELRKLDLVDEITKDINLENLNSRDQICISQVISGFIKLLNQGDVKETSNLEFYAYEAIARKGRHLLTTQMELMSGKKKKKEISKLSPNDYLVDFILKTEFGSGDFYNKEIIPNRIIFDEEMSDGKKYKNNYLALDSLGLEKNENLKVDEKKYNFKIRYFEGNSEDFYELAEKSYFNKMELNKDYLFNENYYSQNCTLENIRFDNSLLYKLDRDSPPKFLNYKCKKCSCNKFILEDGCFDPLYICDECGFELDDTLTFKLLLDGKYIYPYKKFNF